MFSSHVSVEKIALQFILNETQGHFADSLSDDGLFDDAFLTTVFPTTRFSDGNHFSYDRLYDDHFSDGGKKSRQFLPIWPIKIDRSGFWS